MLSLLKPAVRVVSYRHFAQNIGLTLKISQGDPQVGGLLIGVESPRGIMCRVPQLPQQFESIRLTGSVAQILPALDRVPKI